MQLSNNKAKAIKERFEVENNTLKRVVRDDANDEKKGDILEVELGDAKSPNFEPQAKIKRWKNEVNFSLRRKKNWKNPKVRTESIETGAKVKVQDEDEALHMYELDGFEDGGLEVETILKKKPRGKNANQIEFTIETKGLNFYYQPELTQEEKDNGAHRPENVVGSYAVYHESKQNNEYKTGKAFHIYRPHITDAEGNETWGELDIDEESGLLTVTVPQEFLDTAVYPVVVDPTFGYTTLGGSTDTTYRTVVGGFNWTNRVGMTFNLTEEGQIDSITAGLSRGAGGQESVDHIFAINTEDTGNNTHDEVDSSSQETLTIDSDPGDFYTINLSSVTTSAGDYILNLIGDGSSGHDVYVLFDTTGTNTYYQEDDLSSFSASDPWSVSSSSIGDKFSIYATYTATSSASPPTVTTSAVDNITTTSGDGNGEITDTGGADASERGFVYDTSSQSEPTPTETLLDSESFESSLGDWTNTSTDSWERNSGSTPSSDTGPDSAQDGTYYIYVETSSGEGANSKGDETIIEYDIGNTVDGYVDFYYHQYGDDQGTLYLEGWDGSSWNQIWLSSGDQGNQWNHIQQSDTEFSSYSKVRFRNSAAGGWNGDVSLDNINVYKLESASPANSAYSSVKNETGTFGTGTFSLTLDGLSENTTYYVRAYAKNSEGYSYGSEVSFTTSESATTNSKTKSLQYLVEATASALTKSLEYDIADKAYSRESTDTLPTNANDLANIFSSAERTDVGSSDDVRVSQKASGGEYAIEQFKFEHTNDTDKVDISVELQTDYAPSNNSVILEIYNYNTSSWEQIDSNSSAGTGNDFTLSGSKTGSDYYDSNNVVTCRVYQFRPS